MAARISITDLLHIKSSCTKVQPLFSQKFYYANSILNVNLRLMILENKL